MWLGWGGNQNKYIDFSGDHLGACYFQHLSVYTEDPATGCTEHGRRERERAREKRGKLSEVVVRAQRSLVASQPASGRAVRRDVAHLRKQLGSMYAKQLGEIAEGRCWTRRQRNETATQEPIPWRWVWPWPQLALSGLAGLRNPSPSRVGASG